MFGAPQQISTGFASWQRYCTASSSGRQPDFAALNRGRHLCSAGRPSGWALAHISSLLWTCTCCQDTRTLTLSSCLISLLLQSYSRLGLVHKVLWEITGARWLLSPGQQNTNDNSKHRRQPTISHTDFNLLSLIN